MALKSFETRSWTLCEGDWSEQEMKRVYCLEENLYNSRNAEMTKNRKRKIPWEVGGWVWI